MRPQLLLLPIAAIAGLPIVARVTERLEGKWEGESVCVDKVSFPACKDEHVIYHVSKLPRKPNQYHVILNKVVDGKEESMGELDFKFIPKLKSFTSEFRIKKNHGMFSLKIDKALMKGILVDIPTGKTVRRIALSHVH